VQSFHSSLHSREFFGPGDQGEGIEGDLSCSMSTLIPLAEAGGESRPYLQSDNTTSPEMPSTEVGGVSKFDLSTVRRLKTRQNRQHLETPPTPVGGILNSLERFL
jgi:hypothetical protein